MNGSKNKFMELAIALSEKSVAEGGGPFGAVVVRRGEVVATGTNSVTLLNDPTAHAEILALRAAARHETEQRGKHHGKADKTSP